MQTEILNEIYKYGPGNIYESLRDSDCQLTGTQLLDSVLEMNDLQISDLDHESIRELQEWFYIVLCCFSRDGFDDYTHLNIYTKNGITLSITNWTSAVINLMTYDFQLEFIGTEPVVNPAYKLCPLGC